MTRVHDMGGRFGDGPVVPEDEDVKFHADWHPRALAIVLASGSLGKWNIDVSRHARECLAPKDYTAFSYYEKWMGGLAALLVQTGVLTREELAGRTDDQISELATKKLTADQVAGVLARGGPADRESNVAPMFEIGDEVMTRRIAENVLVSGGHTRLPSYAAGAKRADYAVSWHACFAGQQCAWVGRSARAALCGGFSCVRAVAAPGASA